MVRRRSLLSSSVCASVALVAGSVAVVAAAAHADPPEFLPCADAFPADELVDGQTVTGLTTAGRSRGSATTPEPFTGTYLDTLQSDDGDVLVFDLAGSRITRPDGTIDAGIWSGISGSPVYAEDGRLVGAVAYTFGGWEASSVAGVTPAADLYALEADAPEPAERLTLSSTERTRLVAAGAPASEVGTGARRIAPVSAIDLPAKLRAGYGRIADRANAPARDVAAGGTALQEVQPIVPGANLAVADAYGSISAYGLGTATAVCDDEVVGFGHPFDFDTAQRTIHGASTALVQADGGASYKLANLGAPQGALLHDGLAGILGRIGQDVDATLVTSTARARGTEKTYSSRVPNPDALPELAATHAFRDAALVQDQLAGGESLVSWSVKGTSLEDGSPVTLNRTQRYSSRADLAERVGEDLAADLYTLQDNEFARIDVDDVTIDDTLSATYKALKIGSVDRYDTATRSWKRLSTSKAVPAKRGTQLKLRINLVKADKYSKATPQTILSTLHVSRYAYGTGRLTVDGGYRPDWEDEDYEDLAPWETDEFYFEDEEDDELTIPEKEPTTAQGVADLLSAQQRHDGVYVSHDYETASVGLVNNDRRHRTPSIVKGALRFRVSYR